MLRPRTLALAALLAAPLWPGEALAGAREDARAAWKSGKDHFEAGRFADAARAFLEADRLAPNDDVLRDGLVAALKTEDALLAMEAADRAAGRGAADSELAKRRAEAEERFGARVGTLVLSCGACRGATVDGKAVALGRVRVALGAHRVLFDGPAGTVALDVSVEGGKEREVRPPAAAPPPPPLPPPVPPPAAKGGPDGGGLVALGVLAGLTGVSASVMAGFWGYSLSRREEAVRLCPSLDCSTPEFLGAKAAANEWSTNGNYAVVPVVTLAVAAVVTGAVVFATAKPRARGATALPPALARW